MKKNTRYILFVATQLLACALLSQCKTTVKSEDQSTTPVIISEADTSVLPAEEITPVEPVTVAKDTSKKISNGIAAGNKRGHLFVKGRNVAVVPEDEMVSTLVEWAELIHEQGIDAAMARADVAKAEREAAKDRAALLAEQGDDANASEQRVELIHKRVERDG